MSSDALQTSKTMRLRYAGHCGKCEIELPAGTTAVYHRDTKSVTCLACLAEQIPSAPQTTGPVFPESFDDAASTLLDLGPEQSEVFAGVAGASAQREYERRKNKRETRIREAHLRMGGLSLALRDDPQSTKAWATGAQGEERLGRQLDGLVGDGVHVLHDRRIPPTKANIDHIFVCASGVFVIDAKKYQGNAPAFGSRVDGFAPARRHCSSDHAMAPNWSTECTSRSPSSGRCSMRMVSVRCRSAECCALSRPTGH